MLQIITMDTEPHITYRENQWQKNMCCLFFYKMLSSLTSLIVVDGYFNSLVVIVDIAFLFMQSKPKGLSKQFNITKEGSMGL